MRDRIGPAVTSTGIADNLHTLALNGFADLMDVRGDRSKSAAVRQTFCSFHGYKETDDVGALLQVSSVGVFC